MRIDGQPGTRSFSNPVPRIHVKPIVSSGFKAGYRVRFGARCCNQSSSPVFRATIFNAKLHKITRLSPTQLDRVSCNIASSKVRYVDQCFIDRDCNHVRRLSADSCLNRGRTRCNRSDIARLINRSNRWRCTAQRVVPVRFVSGRYCYADLSSTADFKRSLINRNRDRLYWNLASSYRYDVRLGAFTQAVITAYGKAIGSFCLQASNRVGFLVGNFRNLG
ncbi:hypothetical protein FC47_GL001661 [Limosilactobacillus mucosae DSM 13345]|uniref:Uncharacterized protein n=1 Tax=Limosilactobacillus mucosae DSM 13345 TaxID=1423771 RepID=A0A0R1PCK7_LIMMU|nr:hypothetical protein FC47_GL001661 [Limosilactobacillus mucosae DSM 13345]